jgi:hypothetical protein
MDVFYINLLALTEIKCSPKLDKLKICRYKLTNFLLVFCFECWFCLIMLGLLGCAVIFAMVILMLIVWIIKNHDI